MFKKTTYLIFIYLEISMQSYYPERLARCFILNMPGFFVRVWRMVSYFLDKATQEKVCSTSTFNILHHSFHIDSSWIQQHYLGQWL